MSRIETRFKALSAQGRKALVVYLVAGDPEPGLTVDLMHTMVANGADIIELGIPFTDPEAEGPVIQVAHERAMRHNTSLTDVINMVATFRATNQDTPVVLMGYLNPIEYMGYETFAAAASTAGVDGTILVNVPPEEGLVLDQALLAQGLDPVYLLAPTTPLARAKMIFERSRGFTYYVSVKGTTGSGKLDVDAVQGRLEELRSVATTPIAVGFGIKDGESAARVAKIADGAVVGTALVSLMEQYQDQPEAMTRAVAELVKDLRQAMDAVTST